MMATASRLDTFLAQPAPVLDAFGAELARAINARDVAWVLAETAGRLLDLDDCVVYLYDAGLLSQAAAWGPKRVAPKIIEHPIRLALDQGIVGAAASTRLPMLVADSRLYPGYVVDDAPRLSELAVPITHGSALLGVLDSEHPQADFYRSTHLRAAILLIAAAAPRLRAVMG